MQTKRLGTTDLELTRIGLGTWAIGGDWQYGWGPQDDKKSVATIVRALELGINWIDTAPVYGLGNAEEVVGKAVKTFGARPIIATKCGLIWNTKGKVKPKLTRESVRSEVEASLRRLQVDMIDLYQIHWPNPETQIEEAWETIAGFVEEGKIRYAGVSNFNIKQMERVNKIFPAASLQPPYSMLKRENEAEVFSYCERNKLGVIGYSPLQKGILTDKFTRHFVENLPVSDHRCTSDPDFKEPCLSDNLEFVDAIRGMANQKGVLVSDIAVAWVLRRKEVTAAIVGARTPGQLEQNVRASNCTLSQSDLSVIDLLLERKSLGRD